MKADPPKAPTAETLNEIARKLEELSALPSTLITPLSSRVPSKHILSLYRRSVPKKDKP